jgi:hypothetical protein
VPVSIVISKLLYTPVFYSLEGVLIKQQIPPPAPTSLPKRGGKELKKIHPPAPLSLPKKGGIRRKRGKAPLKYSHRWRGVITSNTRQKSLMRTGEARQNHQQDIGKLPRAGRQGKKVNYKRGD